MEREGGKGSDGEGGREGSDVGGKEGGGRPSWALMVGRMRSPFVGVGSSHPWALVIRPWGIVGIRG